MLRGGLRAEGENWGARTEAPQTAARATPDWFLQRFRGPHEIQSKSDVYRVSRVSRTARFAEVVRVCGNSQPPARRICCHSRSSMSWRGGSVRGHGGSLGTTGGAAPMAALRLHRGRCQSGSRRMSQGPSASPRGGHGGCCSLHTCCSHWDSGLGSKRAQRTQCHQVSDLCAEAKKPCLHAEIAAQSPHSGVGHSPPPKAFCQMVSGKDSEGRRPDTVPMCWKFPAGHQASPKTPISAVLPHGHTWGWR